MVLAPDLAEADEVALRLSEAIDFLVDGFVLSGQCIVQGHECNTQAAVVGGILAQREMPVQVLRRSILFGRRGLEAAVFAGDTFGALSECFQVGVGLPLAQIAFSIKLRALVVEAVGHLVADHGADATEVDGWIGLEIEEWRLQDSGREVDVVEAGA